MVPLLLKAANPSISRLNITPTFLFSDTLYSFSFLYLFSDKQGDIEHCCDILRSEIKLLFKVEGMWKAFSFFKIS